MTVFSLKKGVGRPDACGNPEAMKAIGATWDYTWSLNPKKAVEGSQFIPMIHLTHSALSVVGIAGLIPKGSYWLMYNEPDTRWSPDYDPSWYKSPTHFKSVSDALYAYDPTAKIIFGNVYYLMTGSYWPGWIRGFRVAFFNKYKSWPKIAGFGFHMWPFSYNTQAWRAAVKGVRSWQQVDRTGGELWLTEFGWLNNPAIAEMVMKEQVAWLNVQPWLNRYAWYALQTLGESGSLAGFLPSGEWKLSKLGKLYADL